MAGSKGRIFPWGKKKLNHSQLPPPPYRGVENIFEADLDSFAHELPYEPDLDEYGFDRKVDGYERMRRDIHLSTHIKDSGKNAATTTEDFIKKSLADFTLPEGFLLSPNSIMANRTWSSDSFFLVANELRRELHIFALKSLQGPQARYLAGVGGNIYQNDTPCYNGNGVQDEAQEIATRFQKLLASQPPSQRLYRDVVPHAVVVHYGGESTYEQEQAKPPMGTNRPKLLLFPGRYSLLDSLKSECGGKMDRPDVKFVSSLINFCDGR